MNGNAELLNFIYQNSQMGVETINQLIDVVKEPDFKKEVSSQLREYTTINQKAKDLLNRNNCQEKGIGTMKKIGTYLSVNMQTMTDKSSSHIAQMMIIGSNMGIIDAIKNKKQYPHAEGDILNLLTDLQKLEERNVENLKSYL